MKLKDAPWKKIYDQPRQHFKKQRDYFANKGLYSQRYDFSSNVWMWELDHKGEHRRIDAFAMRCWRRLSRVPWTARRSNQSILKEISPECSLEGPMLKLKLQYFGHLLSFPASGSFQMSQLFASNGQSIGVSPSTSVLPINTQDWSPLGWTGWISLQSKGLSRVFSNTTVQKHHFFSGQLSL